MLTKIQKWGNSLALFLASLGFGLLFLLIVFAWFRSDKLHEKLKRKTPRVLLWVMALIGIYFSISGVMSIVDGLSKL